MITPATPVLPKRRGSGEGASLGWEGSPERDAHESPKQSPAAPVLTATVSQTVAKASAPPMNSASKVLKPLEGSDEWLTNFADACQAALSADSVTLPPLDMLKSLCKWLSDEQEIHKASDLFSLSKNLHNKLLDAVPSMGKARLLQQILSTAKALAECPVARERRAVMDITARLKVLGWSDLTEALRPSQDQLTAFVALVEEAASVSPTYKPFPAFKLMEKPWAPTSSWCSASQKSNPPSLTVWLMGWLRHVIAGECCQAWAPVGGLQTMLNLLFTTLEVSTAHSVSYGLQFELMVRTRLSQAMRDGNERLVSRLLQLIRSPVATEVAWLVPPTSATKGAAPHAQAPAQSKRVRGPGKGMSQAFPASQNSSVGSSKGERSRDREFARRDISSRSKPHPKGHARYRSRPRSRPRSRQRSDRDAPKQAKLPVKAQRSTAKGR